VVKLLVEEPETEALDRFLRDWPLRISSELLSVELACVCHRQALPSADADALVSGVRLLPLNDAVLSDACRRFSPPQRTLDALHLASAQQVQEQLGCFVSYDAEQLAAAYSIGLRVAQPGR
jgi:hypothetical protein